MTIPEKIRKLRIENGLTMKSCAENAGIPYYTYQKYEYGEREISVSAVRKLATLYKVSADYLLDGEIETPSQDLIEQLSDAQSEDEFLKKYFMLEPELRDKARKQMQKALKAQQESDDYIVQTTTIGAELDRRESEQAHALSETEVKKTAV